MKELANGNKSLYLDIYRNGKRTYEYLQMYLIPETDNNARVRNQTTMAAANATNRNGSFNLPMAKRVSKPVKRFFFWTG